MFHRHGRLISPPLISLSVVALPGLFQAAEQRRGIPWWVWLLIILVLLLLLWWWLRRRPEEKVPPGIAEPSAPAPSEVEGPAPDDLQRIEGIGPKISGVLQAAGITTFAQLAETDASRLEQIINEADIRIAYPESWPEQARLAAAGEWDALEALQDELKGGRWA